MVIFFFCRNWFVVDFEVARNRIINCSKVLEFRNISCIKPDASERIKLVRRGREYPRKGEGLLLVVRM